ncbi:helix-turn-helix domain-containing protein [Pseudonocardia sp. ICBG601]|uniref:helix-turn-helix domain-containing protein n=1 Tax=Pseudonocardia sp. ICBG601 TaxID=2846759 RepID=UPI001CF716A7
MEREELIRALAECDGNKSIAADRLGIPAPPSTARCACTDLPENASDRLAAAKRPYAGRRTSPGSRSGRKPRQDG